jgi:hypothetical protein
MREARALMRLCKRMVIDKSGMGLAIYEGLEREFWGEVEGITVTLATKKSLAVHGKKRMQEVKCRAFPIRSRSATRSVRLKRL